MLSICITVKNRSVVCAADQELRLLPNCVASIAQSRIDNMPMELVVADWESNDWPLGEWLDHAANPLSARVVTMYGTFSRGRGLNAAAKAARGDILFFLDADVLVSEFVLLRAAEIARQGKAYFPIVYAFDGV